jgi:hypothetical protein
MAYASNYYGGTQTIVSGVQDILSAISGLTPYFNIQAQEIPKFNGIILKNVFNYSKWNFNISGIGSEDSNFNFTIKNNDYDLDSESVLQIDKNGVLYISGQYLGLSSGYLTYSSGSQGTINISIEPQITEKIPEGTFVWDIKNTGTNRQIRSYGYIQVDTPVTKKY